MTGQGEFDEAFNLGPEQLRTWALQALKQRPTNAVFDPDQPPTHGDHGLNANVDPTDDFDKLRPAAVLIPIIAHSNALSVLLTRRADHLSAHAGQVAFPGGKMEPNDVTPRETALREAHEEIGLNSASVDVIGYLDTYQTGTGFRIVPVVALVEAAASTQADPTEVADIFEVPLSFLMDRRNHQRHSIVWQGCRRQYYAMPYGSRYIWGATAGIIRNLHERLIASWPASL